MAMTRSTIRNTRTLRYYFFQSLFTIVSALSSLRHPQHRRTVLSHVGFFSSYSASPVARSRSGKIMNRLALPYSTSRAIRQLPLYYYTTKEGFKMSCFWHIQQKDRYMEQSKSSNNKMFYSRLFLDFSNKVSHSNDHNDPQHLASIGCKIVDSITVICQNKNNQEDDTVYGMENERNPEPSVEADTCKSRIPPNDEREDIAMPLQEEEEEEAEEPYNVRNWRFHPELNPVVHFRTWIVPVSGRSIQSILESRIAQEFLASRVELVQYLNHRLKLVREINPTQSSSASVSPLHQKQRPKRQTHAHLRLRQQDDSEKVENNEFDTIVKKYAESDNQNYKLILLCPDTPPIQELPAPLQNLLGGNSVDSCNGRYNSNKDGAGSPYSNINNTANVRDGPVYPIQFTPDQFTASYILSRVLPTLVHPVPVAFETVGHVAHMNLKRHHLPYKSLIGAVLLSTISTIETVLHKTGDVSGPYRTYPLQVLAGRNDTFVTVIENGVQIQFDLAQVYWCSRLSEERQRLLSVEIEPTISTSKSAKKKLFIADAFCGVGAICLLAAKQWNNNCTIWCNDWNPVAIEYLNNNIVKNGLSSSFERTQCGDAYDFLVDLGLGLSSSIESDEQRLPDHRQNKMYRGARRGGGSRRKTINIAEPEQNGIPQRKRRRLPDHVIMNYPLEAPKFLGALRWWPVSASSTATKSVDECNDSVDVQPRVHVYTFARPDEGTNRSSEEVAVDMVANNLLPLMPLSASKNAALDDNHDETKNNDEDQITQPKDPSINRRIELDTLYNCRISTHEVRDVAPGKVVVCISFTATPMLLRHMQGDFR